MTKDRIGCWTVARSIVDLTDHRVITCSGSAELSPTTEAGDDLVVYREAVSFALSGKFISATRVYRFREVGGAIVATFSDGLPFFVLRLDADGVGTATHPCGDDLYTLRLTLREPVSWETQWDVSGTKNLRISTHYRRPRTIVPAPHSFAMRPAASDQTSTIAP